MNHLSQDISNAMSLQTILPILVLYNVTLADSTTFQTFVASSHQGGLDPTLIAVYDNSPSRHVSPGEAAQLLAYKHDTSNSGIAAAYNWALDIAKSHGFSWLLLLDHDSELPSTFLASLIDTVELYEANQSVAAIVPFAIDGYSMVSPKRVCFGRLAPLPNPAPTVAGCEVMAINSGAAIRVSFLQLLGGFNPIYRLDFLDHWLFRQLYARGKKVALSGSVLRHDLTGNNYRENISLSRYRSILTSEVLFLTTQKRRLELAVYLIRLLLRFVKQLIVYRRPDLAAVTCSMTARIAANGVLLADAKCSSIKNP